MSMYLLNYRCKADGLKTVVRSVGSIPTGNASVKGDCVLCHGPSHSYMGPGGYKYGNLALGESLGHKFQSGLDTKTY
jgi:hypothetical protein